VYAFAATAMQGVKEPATARASRRGVTLPPAFDAWFAKVAAMAPQVRFTSASAAMAALGDVFGVEVAPGRMSSMPGPAPIFATVGAGAADRAARMAPAGPFALTPAGHAADSSMAARTVPLTHVPVSPPTPERTSELPVAEALRPSHPVIHGPTPLTGSGMATTAAPKERAMVRPVLAVVAALVAAVGVTTALLVKLGNADPTVGKDATEATLADAPAAPAAPAALTHSVAPEMAPALEPSSSSIPSAVIPPEPTAATAAATASASPPKEQAEATSGTVKVVPVTTARVTATGSPNPQTLPSTPAKPPVKPIKKVTIERD
jgi:serine/threonine-protein kinase